MLLITVGRRWHDGSRTKNCGRWVIQHYHDAVRTGHVRRPSFKTSVSNVPRNCVSARWAFSRFEVSCCTYADIPDNAMTSPPTVEWQEHLFRRLTSLQQYSTPVTPYSNVSSEAMGARLPSWSPSSGQESPIIPPPSNEPSRRRRRVEGMGALTALNPRPTQPRHDPEGSYAC